MLFEKLEYKDNDPQHPELSKWKKFVWINPFRTFQWIEYDPVSIFDKKLGWLDTFTINGLVQISPKDREFYLYRRRINNLLIFYNRNNGSWFISKGEMTLPKESVYDEHLKLKNLLREPLCPLYNTLPFFKQPAPVPVTVHEPVQKKDLTLETISKQPPECDELPEQNID